MLSRVGPLRTGLAAVLGTVVIVATATAAEAEPEARIAVQSSDTGVSITLSAADGKRPSDIDRDRLEITLTPSDKSKPLIVEGSARQLPGDEQTVMLAIDRSASMGPDGIAEAREAARLFLSSIPNTVRVGLVIFANTAEVAIEPTTDRGQIRQALDQRYQFDQKQNTTSLYRAVDLSIKELGSRGERDLLLLSDGADDTTPEDGTGTRQEGVGFRDWRLTLKNVRRSGVPITAIAFGSQADRQTLGQYERAVDGGDVVDADSGDLQRVFGGLAAQVTSRVAVDVEVPAEFRDKDGTVKIDGFAGGSPFSVISDTVFFATEQAGPSPAATAVAAPTQPVLLEQPRAMITAPVLVAALVALFLAFAVIVGSTLGLAGATQSQETKVLRRLSVYTLSGRQPQQVATQTATTRLGDNVLTRSAVGLVGRVVRNRRFDASIDRLLDAAGIPLRTAEWTLLHIGVAVGSGLVLLILGSGHFVPALIGLLLGSAGPWIYLSVRRERRARAFLAQLPDTLQLLAGSLQAGYSLPQAMDSIVREGNPPIASEFSRALVETRLGMPAEDALDAIAERMGSRDFSWIVMAIRIQRDVGGNLAELLSSVAGTLRERERLRRQVRTLSAEGRLSGWILGLLPVVFVLYLSVVQPEYLAKLYTPQGYVLLSLAGILLVVGSFWMSRVVKVEV